MLEMDMETYIKHRLTEISDSDEKMFAKEVLLKGLLPIFQTVEERYRDLENRVRREMDVDRNRFAVFTTMIRRQDYDSTNQTWFPVCGKDMEDTGLMYRRIFFRGNEARKREFEKTVTITATDASGAQHRMGVRKASDYRNAVEGLYRLFVYNHIPWSTVNTGILDRFYEIYPMEEVAEGEDILEWGISFGEWESYVESDYMALWNIEKFSFQCMKFMVPCLDGKYYEHELDLGDYDPESGYMVEGNEEILSIRYEKDKIIMTSTKETFDCWYAYRFAGQNDMDSYGYRHEILGNRSKETFAECLIGRYGQGIHSRTEICRMAEGLDTEDVLRLVDCGVREREAEGSFAADMNWFIREEIFPMETRRILELHFERKAAEDPEDYHAEDILRYIVSQVQFLLDEYKCVGVLT